MTKESVYEVFGEKIESAQMELPNGGYVFIEDFVFLFGSAPEYPTYEELVEVDGGRMGYIPFFDECKEEGIIE